MCSEFQLSKMVKLLQKLKDGFGRVGDSGFDYD